MTQPPPETALGIARRVADSAITLVGRRIALTALTSLTTAVVARKLGPAEFGTFASAFGAYYLALAIVDLGFGLVLGRDLSRHPDARPRLFATALRVQGAWGACMAIVSWCSACSPESTRRAAACFSRWLRVSRPPDSGQAARCFSCSSGQAGWPRSTS